MFQNLLDDHVAQFPPSVTWATALNANPQMQLLATASADRASGFGRFSVTGVASQFCGIAVGVRDLKGLTIPCVLSFRGKLFGGASVANAIHSICPVLVDRQGVSSIVGGSQIAVAAATDVSLMTPPSVQNTGGQTISCDVTGRVLVRPFIESATPSLTVREFFFGFMIKFQGVPVCDIFATLDARLYEAEERFFQPLK